MRTAAFLAALLIGATGARADCDHFKWRVDQEKAWFARGAEPIEPGANIAIGAGAYRLALKPEDAAGFVMTPKKLTPGAFGAVLHVAAIPKAGLYQVTMTREAWVDVMQNDARARTLNVSRQRDCPGFAKSVRFMLDAGPAVLQINGVTEPSIALSLGAAQ
jgi:hypothetical protein